MTAKIVLSAVAVAAVLALGAPAFAQDNDHSAPAAGSPAPMQDQAQHPAMENNAGGEMQHPAMHHTMRHHMAHHATHHMAHHTMHHAMHHTSHAMHHASAHHGMHDGMHHGMGGHENDSERAETRKLNEQQLHQQ